MNFEAVGTKCGEDEMVKNHKRYIEVIWTLPNLETCMT